MSIAADTPQVLDDQQERLPLQTKLAFGVGDLSPAVATIILGFFQLFFLTTVAGLGPGLAGVILLVAKIWDSITDPVMGWISDRTRSRFGRRRPWLLYGAVPFGLVFLLQWVVPPVGEVGLVLYYLVMVVLLSTVFTMVAVPYTALAPELTYDYNERTSLMSYRFAFSIGGSLVFLINHQQIVGLFESAQTGYLVAGGILGLMMVFPLLVCFAGVRERYTAPAVPTASMSVLEQVQSAFRNRPYLFVIGIYLCSWMVVQITSAVLPFYITYWLQQKDLLLPMILAVQGTAFFFLFFWSIVSRYIGKKLVYVIGAVFWIGVQALLFFLQPNQIGFALVLAILAGVGVATAYLIPWSMMPDVIEFDELRTGERREGIFYGFMVFLQKLGLALGLFLVGQVLQVQGFDENLGVGEQSASALLAIRIMIGPVPTAFLIVGIILAIFYPITKQKHAAVRAELAARKEEGTA